MGLMAEVHSVLPLNSGRQPRTVAITYIVLGISWISVTNKSNTHAIYTQHSAQI